MAKCLFWVYTEIMRRLAVIFTLVAIFFLAFGGRRYLYSFYQHLGAKVGFNFNDIAKDSYVAWIKNQPDEFTNYQQAIFLNKTIYFKDVVAQLQSDVLGASLTPRGEKWVEVDLSEQRLYMKEGQTTVASFLISSGKWSPTPQGEWRIWTKLRYTRMKGGSKALGTYYDLPNVPYVMYYDRGYGIHGAYWHNNFGQPMSHGCVNMKPEGAGVVFNWASVGTRVVVRD